MRLATRQHGVVSAAQLTHLGFTRSMVRRRLEAGRLYRVQPNAYSVLPRLTTPGRMMAAALSCGRGAGLSHRAGAAVWQLGPWPTGLIDVSSPRSLKPRAGVLLHRVAIEVVTQDGFPVTTPMRTLADLAATEPEPRVERAYEQADRLRLLDVVPLEAECEGRRGSRLLRRLIAEGREAPPAKNELERALLSLCRDYDIPPPSQNVMLGGLEVDAYWPDAGLVVELDGWRWHSTRRAFEDDRRRDAHLATLGIRVLRFSWRQMTRERGSVAGAIRAGLRGAGLRPACERATASSSTAPPRGSSAGGSWPPRWVPAISSSGDFSLGMKPDFMPKYTAWGWWATIATVDCSGITACPPDSVIPISSRSSSRQTFSCSDWSGQAG